MRIIKREKIPEEKEIEISCSNCKSLLSAKCSEGKLAYGLDPTYIYYFKCPVCFKTFSVDTMKFDKEKNDG